MSVEDLLRYYPNKYIDRTRVYKVQELEEGMASVQVIGQLLYLYEKVDVKDWKECLTMEQEPSDWYGSVVSAI